MITRRVSFVGSRPRRTSPPRRRSSMETATRASSAALARAAPWSRQLPCPFRFRFRLLNSRPGWSWLWTVLPASAAVSASGPTPLLLGVGLRFTTFWPAFLVELTGSSGRLLWWWQRRRLVHVLVRRRVTQTRHLLSITITHRWGDRSSSSTLISTSRPHLKWREEIVGKIVINKSFCWFLNGNDALIFLEEADLRKFKIVC